MASNATAGAGATGERGGEVAVVGGGLAGLSAAIRLTRAGFRVTLFEAKPTLGGNLSSQVVDETYHDVYPHMFCQWYGNFWDLFETDLGIPREASFEARQGVKVLRKGSTEYLNLLNGTTLDAALANLKSGWLSPAEMFLLGFSMIDLVAHPFDRRGPDQLNMLDVNGFIYSRGYATEPVASVQNYMLMLIWSIKSSMTAAASYQDFIKHTLTYPDGAPFAWMLKGSLAEKVLHPLEKKLVALGCAVLPDAAVTSVRMIEGRPEIRTADAVHSFDHVVLAVSPTALTQLVMGGDDALPGCRIIEKLPQLSQLQQLRAVPIPVVDLYLKIRLPDFPKEHIGLAGSDFDLTVLDFSQLWSDEIFTGTALVIAASEPTALPSLDPKVQGHMIIAELWACIPQFRPGAYWGDPDSDIDWTRTHYRSNADYPLFINDIGSWEWRPDAAYPDRLPRVYFAGDFCQTDVDMATVEAATQSGILAARAVQQQDAALNGGVLRGAPVVMKGHKVYSTATFRAAKLALLPFAYGALVWSARNQAKRLEEEGNAPMGSAQYTLSEYVALVPMLYTLDWVKTAYWLVRSLSDETAVAGTRGAAMDGNSLTGAAPASADPSAAVDDDDEIIGLKQASLIMAADLFDNLAKRLPAREGAGGDAKPSTTAAMGSLLTGLTRLAGEAIGLVADAWGDARAAQQAGAAGAAPPPDFKRRARVKP